MRARMLLVLALAGGAGAAGAARTSQDPQPERLSQRKALGLVRVVNTAEADLSLKNQSFASLEDVLSRLQSQGAEFGAALTDKDSARVKDHRLSIVLSPDGHHYRLDLVPLENAGCAPALFSDETGVIYTARPLGCAQTEIWDDIPRATSKAQ